MEYTKETARQAAREQFRGVWAAITTPFTPEGDVDEAGLRQNMRYLIDDIKIDGVFCAGIVGEFWALTNEERKRVIQIVAEEAKGKIRTIAHTGHTCLRDAIDLTRYAQEVGADFAVLIPPYYPNTDDEEMYTFFRALADEVEIGFWIFDTFYTGRALSPAFYSRLAEDVPHFCGLKYQRGLPAYFEVKRLVGDKIVLSDPTEDNLLMLTQLGQQVFMSSPVPYLYQHGGSRKMKEYAELAAQGRVQEAARICYELEPVRAVHNKWIVQPSLRRRALAIEAIKAWSELMGMAAGPVRPPLRSFSEEQKQQLRADLESVGLLPAAQASRTA